MSTIVILGGGVSGHTCALHLRDKLSKKEHKVIVVTPNSLWNWIPSNVWVGVGKMNKEDVTFSLSEIYKKQGVDFIQGLGQVIFPSGDQSRHKPFIRIESTQESHKGEIIDLEYDFLVNATGPKLKFEATPGLGPDKNSMSICTYSHAEEAAKEVDRMIDKMKQGEVVEFLVGTGHGTCTCQGAAFEYLLNLEHLISELGLRDRARMIWLSNEYELGDFGMGGLSLKKGGYITNSKTFTESLFSERGIEWITQAHVIEVEKDRVHYETLEGEEKEQSFDFAMLLPPFSGVGLSAKDKNGEDITHELFMPNGFMKVDGDYSKKEYENWKADDWPSTYQNPLFKNIFAIGIAFAPPHSISKPMVSKLGTPITPAPPRTGMPSAVSGKAVAMSIVDMINKKTEIPTHKASMAKMGASCVASTGTGAFSGSAATITVFPIVPDFNKYPEYGRDMNLTFGEIGLAGHWLKYLLHVMFIHKAKARFGWKWIPE